MNGNYTVLAEGFTFTTVIEHAKTYGKDVDVIRVGSGINTTYSVVWPADQASVKEVVAQIRVKTEVFVGLPLWERLTHRAAYEGEDRRTEKEKQRG